MCKAETNDLEKKMAARWKRLIPPSRPSKDYMALYEKYVLLEAEKKDKLTWGLLGCTPEIRSLAGKYQAEILCIDNNPAAFPAFRLLCEPSKNEKFLCSDWLDVNLPEKFDVILGDGAVSMLPLEKHEALLNSIYKMLKPEGIALLRIHVIAPSQFENPRQIFDWYRENAADKPVYYATKPHLNQFCLDPETMKTNINLLQNMIQNLYTDKIIDTEEFEAFEKLKDGSTELQYTKKELFEQIVAPYFKIEGIYYARDFPNGLNRPLYHLRKKTKKQFPVNEK